MKTKPYSFKTKYGEKNVNAATMMDINKTIQRATVKALGLHGLGLYIYAGEDLPESSKDEAPKVTIEKAAKKEEPASSPAKGNFRRKAKQAVVEADDGL